MRSADDRGHWYNCSKEFGIKFMIYVSVLWCSWCARTNTKTIGIIDAFLQVVALSDQSLDDSIRSADDSRHWYNCSREFLNKIHDFISVCRGVRGVQGPIQRPLASLTGLRR